MDVLAAGEEGVDRVYFLLDEGTHQLVLVQVFEVGIVGAVFGAPLVHVIKRLSGSRRPGSYGLRPA